LETEKKFLPDISEVVEAIQRYDTLWDGRKRAVWSIERKATELADLIAHEQPRVEAELALAEARDLQSKWNTSLALFGTRKQDAISAQNRAAAAAQKVEETMMKLAEWELEVAKPAENYIAARDKAAAAAARCEKINGERG
jgi:hypothetical protein